MFVPKKKKDNVCKNTCKNDEHFDGFYF